MEQLNYQKSSISSVNYRPEIIKEDSKLERSKYVYDQINGWIENADNKVSVSCGVFTGVFGIFAFLTEWYVKVPQDLVINECWNLVYHWSFFLSILTIVISFFFYAKAIIPNLKSSGKTKATQKKFPLYYGDIHSMQMESYQELMKKGTDRDFDEELVLESWFNAGICFRKMKCYKQGVISSLVAIGFVVISFMAHYLMYT